MYKIYLHLMFNKEAFVKRWSAVAIAATVVAAAWFVHQKMVTNKGRMIDLEDANGTPNEQFVRYDSAPEGVPVKAYKAACDVIHAGAVPHNEFRAEDGTIKWRHSLIEHYFDAAWTEGHWVLMKLIRRDDTERPMPDDLDRVILDWDVLVADLQDRRIEPRPAGFVN